MNKKTFNKWDIAAAVNEDTDGNSPLVLVKAEQWIDEGKYQRQEYILRDMSTGLFYRYLLSKTGSHYTELTYSFDWEKDKIELTEVVEIVVETEIWVNAEDG